jgi:hypothetical protein
MIYITLSNSAGELARTTITSDDGTGEAAANAAIRLIRESGGPHPGDTIAVIEATDRDA